VFWLCRFSKQYAAGSANPRQRAELFRAMNAFAPEIYELDEKSALDPLD
jgi:hypothetical protein